MEYEKKYTSEITGNVKRGARTLFVPGHHLYKANEQMIKRRVADAFDSRLRGK